MWLAHYQWAKIIHKKIRELHRVETSLGQVTSMQMKIIYSIVSTVCCTVARWLKIIQNNIKMAVQKVLLADKYRVLFVHQMGLKVT